MIHPGIPRFHAWLLGFTVLVGSVSWGYCETEVPVDEQADDKEFHLERKSVVFSISRSEIGGDALEGFSDYTLMWANGPQEMMRINIGLYYGRGSVGEEPDLQDGVEWISEAGLELGFGAYLSPDRSPVGIFIPFGLRVGAMFWSYTYPAEVETEDGGTEILTEGGGLVLTPYIGLGTSLLQTRRINLGLSITVGYRFTWGEAGHDFDDLLFEDVGEIRFGFEAGFYY